jgi:hypothetical protein
MALRQPHGGAAALTLWNPYATHRTLCSGKARDGGDRRGTNYKLGETS